MTTAEDLAEGISGSLVNAEDLSGKLGTALAAVALLAAFGIASLLTLSSVSKRTRELGTLKALGWRQWLVVRQVSGEAVAQGLLGGLAGVLIGVGGAAAIGALGLTLEASAGTGAQPMGPFGQGAVEAGDEHRHARRAGRPLRDCNGHRFGAARRADRWSGRRTACGAAPAGRGAAERRVTATWATEMNPEPRSEQMNGSTTNGAEPSTAPLYRLAGTSKAYGGGSVGVQALDRVDLEIAEREFVVIIGPSGSGKSTLLQMLGALDRPSAGAVTFEGRDLADLSDADLAGIRSETIGFVFQQFNLIPTLSARENVEIAMAPRGLRAAERAATAAEMLDRVGLSARAEHLPAQLSGGEQQRVAIARALTNRPYVLLADEPTGNLDSATGRSILDLLEELWRATGLTVVLITHDDEIAARAPRVVRLADGRVASDERRSPDAELRIEAAR